MRMELPDVFREEYGKADGGRRLYLKTNITEALSAGASHGEVLEKLRADGWSEPLAKWAIVLFSRHGKYNEIVMSSVSEGEKRAAEAELGKKMARAGWFSILKAVIVPGLQSRRTGKIVDAGAEVSAGSRLREGLKVHEKLNEEALHPDFDSERRGYTGI